MSGPSNPSKNISISIDTYNRLSKFRKELGFVSPHVIIRHLLDMCEEMIDPTNTNHKDK